MIVTELLLHSSTTTSVDFISEFVPMQHLVINRVLHKCIYISGTQLNLNSKLITEAIIKSLLSGQFKSNIK